MTTKMSDAVKAAYEHVWTNFEEFVKMCAKEHTIANMGQDLEDYAHDSCRPGDLVDDAYQQFLNDICETDEMLDGITDEYRMWLKDARRDALLVQKAKLPLTLANARRAFMCEFPFTRPAKK